VTINGQFVGLFSEPGADGVRHLWREEAPGTFVAEIVDDKDAVVAHITRTYEFDPATFVFRVRQVFDNRTALPMKIEWVQYGPVDLSEDKTGYSIDVRRLRFGYLLNPKYAPGTVEADTKLGGRASLVKRWFERGGVLPPLWPDAAKYKNAEALSWVAQTSRYFAFVVLPLVNDPAAAGVNKALPIGARVDAVVLGMPKDARVALQLTSPVVDVPAGQTADLSFAAYAGPLAREQLSSKANPVFGALGLDKLVIFNLGGMCAFCTFQWIAIPLVRFLGFLHDNVVFDWAIAIMILVFCVRAVLHPITKKSQVGMQRFARQMQRIAPKQKKLQEKYKGEPKVLQAEIAKLMREEKVSYRGALGCLPMFLQTPIWIAVYAVIYFNFALRHESAFYGVFQSLTGGKWTFLGDLAAPDHFIEFGRAFHIPFLSGMMGPISGINILPLILGVVFYIQQKYLTPPPTAQMTPEQEQQQKIMKFMMVVMFPLFMYNAPSALALYFMTNSTLGILESRYIRAHIDQLELDKEIDAATGRKQVVNQAKLPFQKDRDKKRFKGRE
jgi:YidC/Oxa1 family membrane protein insertase